MIDVPAECGPGFEPWLVGRESDESLFVYLPLLLSLTKSFGLCQFPDAVFSSAFFCLPTPPDSSRFYPDMLETAPATCRP